MPPLKHKNDSVWNEEIENLLKQAQRDCVKYAKLHTYDSERYANFHNYLFITNAFLTSLSGTSVIIKNSFFSDIEQETSSLINILFGVILIFATVLSSFQYTTNYIEQSRNHKDASKKFTSLGNNMLKLLALDKATKETSIDFYEWSESEFTNLQIQSPNPSNTAYKMYKIEHPLELLNIKVDKDNINETTEINRMSNEIDGTDQDPDEISEQSKQTIMDFNKKRFANNMYI